MATTNSQPGTRVETLEAIRGIAALVVVLHHLAHTFWPVALHTTAPWRSVFDGSFAVTLFFVLSGIVLSIAYFQRPAAATLGTAAVRRYFRLTLPILSTVLLGYVLMKVGAFANVAAADAMGRAPDQWLRHFYTFRPNLWNALKEGGYGVYRTYDSSHSYNAVLWTMSVELYGSFFVLALLALVGSQRRRWILYLVLAAFLHAQWSYTLNFLFGLALCDYYVRTRTAPIPPKFGALTGTVLLLAGVFIGSGVPGWFGDWIGIEFTSRRLDCQTFGAVLIVLVALFCPFWERVLKLRVLVWLGGISFALYLLHHLVICSVGCGVFVRLRDASGWSFEAAALGSTAVALVVTLAAAWGMTRTVDRWSIALGRRISRLFIGTQPREPDRPRHIASMNFAGRITQAKNGKKRDILECR